MGSMNTVEIILTTIGITIVWIGYGLYAAAMTEDSILEDDGGSVWTNYILYMILAPIVLCAKAFWGIFKPYK